MTTGHMIFSCVTILSIILVCLSYLQLTIEWVFVDNIPLFCHLLTGYIMLIFFISKRFSLIDNNFVCVVENNEPLIII